MKQLQVITPIYVDNIGSVVQLYFNDFITTSYRLLDCYIKKIARNQLIDITEAKKLIKKSLNIVKDPPIYFKNRTYCMIKVRKPITKNDGGYGLFNINSIEIIETGGLTLKSNEKVIALGSEESTEGEIQKAKLARLLIDDYTTNLDILTK